MAGMHERAAQVLADLARQSDVEARSVEDVLAHITETAARTLDVQRVNVWLYDTARATITCVEDYDRVLEDHGSGAVLRVEDSPRYFEALDQLRGVAAFDARTDPRMTGLRTYLRAHGVSAVLDVPLLRSGHVVGVVCHEHVGEPRAFDEWEGAFAAAIGDLVSLVLETDRRVRAERERRLLVEQLARSRQVDSLGWVAAGVAHDLRNLLTVVFTNVDLLQAGPHPQALAHIERAAERARDLCTLLLESSGRLPAQRTSVDAARVTRELLGLLATTRRSDVAVDLVVAPNVAPVLAEAAGLERVLLNLVTNATEAMPPEGGRVTVSLRPGAPDDRPGWDFRADPALPTVVLQVQDDGRGMDAVTEERAVEPFFTTKTTSGSGSGFGLATVVGTARSHQGAFDLTSTPGAGTTVRVWFPAAG